MKRSAAGLAAILTLTVTIRGGSQDPQERPVPRVATPALVERSAYLMGTRVRLLTWADSRFDGLARLEHALTTLEQTEAELSTWRDDSAIAVLNRSPVGSPWSASPAICRMFAVLSDWQTASGGAFDPSIGRLIQAWDVHGQGRIPSPADLAQARASSGFRHLDFDAVRCTVTRRADVAIDVGAFGKGEALDRVEQRLGDEPWMVDFGGQVSVHGVPPGRGEWPVSIAHPLDRQRAYVEVALRAGSLSTSAGSERDLFVNGRRIAPPPRSANRRPCGVWRLGHRLAPPRPRRRHHVDRVVRHGPGRGAPMGGIARHCRLLPGSGRGPRGFDAGDNRVPKERAILVGDRRALTVDR